jgi:peptidoglycan-associated lipoprotein
MKKMHFAAIGLLALTVTQCTKKPEPVIEAPAVSSVQASSSEYIAPSSEVIASSSSAVVDPKAELKALIQQITDPSNTIYFEFDSEELSAEGSAVCQKIADLMRSKTGSTVVVKISGHADDRGTEQYNMILADKRAKAIKKYIADLGVQASRISTVSMGKMSPAVEGNTEESWAKNRRGEFEAKSKE